MCVIPRLIYNQLVSCVKPKNHFRGGKQRFFNCRLHPTSSVTPTGTLVLHTHLLPVRGVTSATAGEDYSVSLFTRTRYLDLKLGRTRVSQGHVTVVDKSLRKDLFGVTENKFSCSPMGILGWIGRVVLEVLSFRLFPYPPEPKVRTKTWVLNFPVHDQEKIDTGSQRSRHFVRVKYMVWLDRTSNYSITHTSFKILDLSLHLYNRQIVRVGWSRFEKEGGPLKGPTIPNEQGTSSLTYESFCMFWLNLRLYVLTIGVHNEGIPKEGFSLVLEFDLCK